MEYSNEDPLEWDENFMEWEDWDFQDDEVLIPSSYYSLGGWPKFLIISTILACTIMAALLTTVTAQIAFSNEAEPNHELTGFALGQKMEAQADQQDEENKDMLQTNRLQLECSVSDRFPTSIRQWCGLITQYAQKRGLPPDLVAALIWQESGGNPHAYSKSGAVGLMQVMPSDGLAASFRCANGPCFSNRPSTNQLKDPEYNVSYGTKMLAGLLGKTGNLREALKSYGPMDVGYYYADKVMGIFERYRN